MYFWDGAGMSRSVVATRAGFARECSITYRDARKKGVSAEDARAHVSTMIRIWKNGYATCVNDFKKASDAYEKRQVKKQIARKVTQTVGANA